MRVGALNLRAIFQPVTAIIPGDGLIQLRVEVPLGLRQFSGDMAKTFDGALRIVHARGRTN
jgi:hypothetical protein